MEHADQTPTPAFTTSVFGGVPYQTNVASQGSVQLYQSTDCSEPLSEDPTPLVVGECLNMPLDGIGSISISSLPACADNGTPLLYISNSIDCTNNTAGTSADSGVVNKCLAFDDEGDIGSVILACYGNGISSVDGAAATTSAQPEYTEPATTGDGSDGSTYSSDSDYSDDGCACDCECCCIVM